jgi:uncharacterized protein (DUF302 family)
MCRAQLYGRKRTKTMLKFLVLAACLALQVPAAFAAEGLVTVPSVHNPKTTIDRLEAAVAAGGSTVFARVDHAAGAATVGMTMRPTVLLIFGNPKAGSPLMLDQQTMGIDLPLRALAYEDKDGKTWLSYNDPSWLAARHGVTPGAAAVTEKIKAGIAAAVAKASGPE